MLSASVLRRPCVDVVFGMCSLVGAGSLWAQAAAVRPKVESTLHTIGVAEGARQPVTVYSKAGSIEAPVWTRDGASLIFNTDGMMMKVAASGGTPEVLSTGETTRCTGSHGVSPDGRELAITCGLPGRPEARVYVTPVGGGTPRQVTETGGSYFHGWSPNGKTILVTRGGQGAHDIFAINSDGTGERKLTPGKGIDDDPDFSPDGRWIYFNSDRSGTQQIWRMRPDGTGAEQMTNDARANWTPHPSPDGRYVLFLSYKPETAGHPGNQEVELRLLSPESKSVTALVSLVGGAGTDNVNCWSPDGAKVAYVSYQVVAVESK